MTTNDKEMIHIWLKELDRVVDSLNDLRRVIPELTGSVDSIYTSNILAIMNAAHGIFTVVADSTSDPVT